MLQFVVGNGNMVFLWHDNWHSKGPLLLAYPYRLILESVLPSHLKLSVVIHGSNWHWSGARSEEMVELQILLCDQIYPNSGENEPKWLPSKSGVFHVGAT